MASTIETTAAQMLAILGLAPGATLVEIKQARTDLIKVWHPDRFPNDTHLQRKADEKLKEINAAYEWLCSHPESSRFDAEPSGPDPQESFRRSTSDPTHRTPARRSRKRPYPRSRRRDPFPKPGLSNRTQINLRKAGFLILGIGWLGLMVSVMGYVGLAVGSLVAYAVYKVAQVFK